MCKFSTVASIATLLFACIGPAPLTTLAATTDFKQPNAYAVVIGISQYREEVIPKVAYAAKDAEAVAQLLETQGGIPKTHIKLLTDSKATYNDIRNHVNDWLKMRVKPESVVYIYYAGHGTPNPQTGEVYLVPWEGHPDFPSGLYPLKDFYAALNKLPAKEIVVMLDSCFSGAPGRSVLAKGTRPMVITLENPLLAGGKIAVLSASTGNQMSSDYEKTGHGLFTHYLLTGLGGAADEDKNRLVTLKELYPYVRKHVAETAVQELNREQTPTLLPAEDILGPRAAQTLVWVPAWMDAPAIEDVPLQEARARPYEAPRQTSKEITGKDGAPMMLIPEGEFLYGEDKRRISIEAFYMDKFEVSNSLYFAFMQKIGRKEPSYLNSTQLSSIGTLPVFSVDWTEADAYCRYYGKRLPTEEEWEKAARGTDGRMYPWGNSRNSSYANYGKDDSGQYALVMPIGSFEAGKSPYGVYDMAGNVAEWTFSEYGSHPGIKVVRGGSWNTPSQNVRTTFRGDFGRLAQNGALGFRCVQEESE